MNKTNMKSIVILKNLPSNLIDEAIVVIKDKKKIKEEDYNKLIENEKNRLNQNKKKKNKCIQGYINAEELSKIEKIEKENRKYVIKEAELVIGNYLSNLEKNEKEKKAKRLQAKCKRIKIINLILTFLTLISFIIAIKK